MKKKKINKVLSLRKQTVTDLSLNEQTEAKAGAKPSGPNWTCYYPTFCYPSPYTDCSPTECGIPC